MEIFFADDSYQQGSRGGMGEVIGLGGVMLPEESLPPLRETMEKIYAEFGVPSGTEMKWSPKEGNWIRESLGSKRTDLYRRMVRAAGELDGRVIVVAWDTGRTTLKKGPRLHRWLVRFLFERITMHLQRRGKLGIIICDRPGGAKKDEDELLADVVAIVEKGTDYVQSTQVVMNLLTAPSHVNPYLQLADVIMGATIAMVTGKTTWAGPVFEEIRPMFIKNYLGRAGSTGLVLFPRELMNLYFYILGETDFTKASKMSGIPIPWPSLPYYYDGADSSCRSPERGDRSAA